MTRAESSGLFGSTGFGSKRDASPLGLRSRTPWVEPALPGPPDASTLSPLQQNGARRSPRQRGPPPRERPRPGANLARILGGKKGEVPLTPEDDHAPPFYLSPRTCPKTELSSSAISRSSTAREPVSASKSNEALASPVSRAEMASHPALRNLQRSSHRRGSTTLLSSLCWELYIIIIIER